MSEKVRNIRPDLAAEIDAIWAKRRGHGVFNLADIEADTISLLEGLDLNAYRKELADVLAQVMLLEHDGQIPKADDDEDE